MSKFKIGDIVIGNDSANNAYSYTRMGWKGRVTDINGNGFSALSLKDGSIYNNLKGNHFDLYKYKSYKAKSFYNDKVVVYFNKDGKKGVAVNTDKKFDLEKGLAFAMLKTFGVTYTQFEEELKKLEKQEMKPKFKKIEVTTMGDDKKQFTKVEKQKDPIEKMIKKFEKGAKNGKRNTKKDDK